MEDPQYTNEPSLEADYRGYVISSTARTNASGACAARRGNAARTAHQLEPGYPAARQPAWSIRCFGCPDARWRHSRCAEGRDPILEVLILGDQVIEHLQAAAAG